MREKVPRIAEIGATLKARLKKSSEWVEIPVFIPHPEVVQSNTFLQRASITRAGPFIYKVLSVLIIIIFSVNFKSSLGFWDFGL